MPDILEFMANTDSEASDVESPRFEDIVSAGIPQDAPGGVGRAPMEEVKVEEEEEEDLDVHFKRKRKGGPQRKRVVKKPHHHTPIIT